MSDNSKIYDESFYEPLQEGVLKSAQQVAPFIRELIQPNSVIDVGCGLGIWLSVFQKLGVSDFLGVDGNYVDRLKLAISPDHFEHRDLTKPIRLNRSFDLVVCLEVAEHLPESCAHQFVETLTSLGTTILFSAAIPGQGGTEHINEQWPEYWAELFSSFGFTSLDIIRERFWDNDEVEWWYSQNTILYVPQESTNIPSRFGGFSQENEMPIRKTHPKMQAKLEWEANTAMVLDILHHLPADLSPIILLGSHELHMEGLERIKVFPFSERDGNFAGFPAGDSEAILETERLRKAGAGAIGIPWSLFWVLDVYQNFIQHLYTNCRVIHEDENLLLFAFSVE